MEVPQQKTVTGTGNAGRAGQRKGDAAVGGNQPADKLQESAQSEDGDFKEK